MTKTQAFVDGFVGKPIKNECFNLWDLNAIIREKQAKLYKEILNLERNNSKKSQNKKHLILLNKKIKIKKIHLKLSILSLIFLWRMNLML
ncbi:hypothetical protein ACT2TZ_001734 [Campylobacter coli]